jgi:hypothetical protein
VPEHTQRLLQLRNAHPRDARIVFYPGPHEYRVDGVPTSGSVTGLVHAFADEFDAPVVIKKMMAGRRWPRAGYLQPDLARFASPAIEAVDGALAQALRDEDEEAVATHAQRIAKQAHHAPTTYSAIRALALSADVIQQQWKANGTESANRGTWMHLTFELWLNRDGVPMDGVEMGLFQRWVRECPQNLRAYRTEWEVYGEEENIAGSIDFIAENEDGDLVIIDWKRTKKLRDSFQNPFRKMNAPLDHLDDCKGSHYELQLNCYRYIVQKYYGRRVVQMLVVCAHPDNGDAAFVHEVPLRDHETSYLMWWQRQRCSALIGERMLRALKPEQPPEAKRAKKDDSERAALPKFPFSL